MGKSQDMCTKIPDNDLEERLRWVIPVIKKQIKLVDAARVFSGGQRTLERWVAAYKKDGEISLVPKSTRPKSEPNETSIRIKERIIELRKETKLCARKLNYKLKKENISIHDRTIGKIIKAEGLVRKYRIRKLKYKYIKVPLAKGDLVEIDIKYVPDLIENKQYYQFTAIDCASRWRYLEIYENGDNLCALDFLNQVLKIAPFRVMAIKNRQWQLFY
jgi:transposase